MQLGLSLSLTGLPVLASQGGGGALDRTKHTAIVGGQSLASYMFKSGGPVVTERWGESIRTALDIAASSAFATYGSNGAFVTHNGSSELATDDTVRLTNTASQGSSLLDVAGIPSSNSEFGSGVKNYWWNTQDNSAATGDGTDLTYLPALLFRGAGLSISDAIATASSCIGSYSTTGHTMTRRTGKRLGTWLEITVRPA